MGSLTLDSVTYKAALKDVSLFVEAGETAAVVVDRKTDRDALLRIAAQADIPDAGKVTVQGRLVFAQRDWPLMGGSDVLDQLSLPLHAIGYTVPQAHAAAMQALGRWDLEDWAGRELCELEDHELARLSLIRAVISKPDVLLVDDPAIGLATGMFTETVRTLLKFAALEGAAVLMVCSETGPMVGVRGLYSLNDGTLLGSRPSPAQVIDWPRALA